MAIGMSPTLPGMHCTVRLLAWIDQFLNLKLDLCKTNRIQKFRCYEAKIEESEKAGSRWESNPGHLACAASALPLSYDNQTTTSPHNPLYVLHRWD